MRKTTITVAAVTTALVLGSGLAVAQAGDGSNDQGRRPAMGSGMMGERPVGPPPGGWMAGPMDRHMRDVMRDRMRDGVAEVMDGLVQDGTLTREQADAVINALEQRAQDARREFLQQWRSGEPVGPSTSVTPSAS